VQKKVAASLVAKKKLRSVKMAPVKNPKHPLIAKMALVTRKNLKR
jgi:hypothetical protein